MFRIRCALLFFLLWLLVDAKTLSHQSSCLLQTGRRPCHGSSCKRSSLSEKEGEPAKKGSESQFLLGPVVQRFVKNVSSHPQHLSQVAQVSPDVSSLVSGQACPCTWNAAYPCSLDGTCYSLSSKASCEGHGGQFCGAGGGAAPTCTCTWDPDFRCSLKGSCWGYKTQGACEAAGGKFCGENGPDPAPAPTPAPAPIPSGSLDSEMQAALDEHNKLRAKHQAPDLTWDAALAAQAQSWAGACAFEHSKMGNGENLWAGYGSAFSGAAAVKSWYDELTNPGYDFSNPGFSHGTGHFTQVVWKSTTRVGCAVQVCKPLKPMSWNPGNFFVCEYSPPGNYQGQFAGNVLQAS